MTYSNNNYNDQTDDNQSVNQPTDQTDQTTDQTTDEVAPPYTVIGDDISNGESVTFATINDLQRGIIGDDFDPNDPDLQEIIDALPDDFEAGTLGVFEMYNCLPTNDDGTLIEYPDGTIEGFDKDELEEAQIKMGYGSVTSRNDRGWKLDKDGNVETDDDGNPVFERGDHINYGTQLEKNYCVNFPYPGGWDYIDYESVPNLRGPLGSGVIPLVTVPFGPPVTYGNRSHNPNRSQRANNNNYIRRQGNGIQWNHVLPEGEGLQDNIEKGTDWESGQTKTGTTAEQNMTMPSVNSFAGGSHGILSDDNTIHNGIEIRFGKHQNKMSSGKKTTHNNVMLGHDNDTKGPTTYDFGVVGASCFLYPHRGNTNHDSSERQFGHAYWYVQNVYGVYRWDSDEDELTERMELFEMISAYVDKLGIGLPGAGEDVRSASTTQNIFRNLYENGTFAEAKKIRIPSNRHGHLYLQTFFDILNVVDERNKDLPDHEHRRYHKYDWICEHLSIRKNISVVDLFSVIYSSLIGVPREALDILGRPLDIEALGKADVEEISEIQNIRLNKDRFIIWAYMAMKAKDISFVGDDEGEIRIITSQDKSITFREFVNWNDWGFISACERNGGLFTSDVNDDQDGKTFKRYHWCVEEESYADDPEFPVHVLDPLLLDSKVYIGEDVGYNDYNDFDTQLMLASGASTRSGDGGGGAWADIDDIRQMTKYSSVKGTWSDFTRKKDEIDSTVASMAFTFQANEMDKYYEWYNPIQLDGNQEEVPYRDENGKVLKSNLRGDLAELGAKPAIDIFHSDKPNGTAGTWHFVLTIEPGQRRIYRPDAGKANFKNRRYFKAQASCPKRVSGNFDGSGDCNRFRKGWYDDYVAEPSLIGYGYNFKLNITPATKRGENEIIAEETQGPAYWAEDTRVGWPEPDWMSDYWDLPMNPMRIKGPTGKMQLLTPGEFYEVKVAYETGQLISQYKTYPEFHAWWGRDRECINPQDATNKVNLFTSGFTNDPSGPRGHRCHL